MSAFSLTGVATDLISSLGYGGLAFGLVLDSAGLPIPSEVLLPISGALINSGRFSLAAVVIVGILAQTAGAVLSYWIGATGGLILVKKYGKYVLFSEHELGIAERAFNRYGQWLTFFGRCVPVVRTYIGYPAGLTKMDFKKFLAATVVGSTFWTLLLTELGVRLATPARLLGLDHLFRRFNLIVLVLLVAAVIWYVRRHLKRA